MLAEAARPAEEMRIRNVSWRHMLGEDLPAIWHDARSTTPHPAGAERVAAAGNIPYPRRHLQAPRSVVPGWLDELVVLTMSTDGVIAMKKQFATLRNGRPLRDRDIRDIAVLRELTTAIT